MQITMVESMMQLGLVKICPWVWVWVVAMSVGQKPCRLRRGDQLHHRLHQNHDHVGFRFSAFYFLHFSSRMYFILCLAATIIRSISSIHFVSMILILMEKNKPSQLCPVSSPNNMNLEHTYLLTINKCN